MSASKKKRPYVKWKSLTAAQLLALASDCEDRTAELLIDDEQLQEEQGFDVIAVRKALARFLRREASRRV